MNAVQLHLPLLILAIFASEVFSRIYYKWQEADRVSDSEQYRWYLTGNPTDCTVIRLGGLNTKMHQIRRPEVRIDEDHDKENLEGVVTAGTPSSSSGMISYDNTPSCVVTTSSGDSSLPRYPTHHDRFSQPLRRLEFTVLTSGPVSLYAYVYLNDYYGSAVYIAGLGSESSDIFQFYKLRKLSTAEGVEFPGRFWLTSNSGEIQVGKVGNDTALMHYQDNSFSSSDDFWSIWLQSTGPVEWLIYLPYEEQAPCPA